MARSEGIRWGGAKGRVQIGAVRLAGAHVEVNARGIELRQAQVGECAVVAHLRASAGHSVSRKAALMPECYRSGRCVWRTSRPLPVEKSCGTS
eukprot:scaffold236971_cov39-Tisochrysis_lutea.AAC.1